MSAGIEALYIYSQHNTPILQHIYRSRPSSASVLIREYLSHPSPRPSLIYLPNLSPPTIVLSLLHSGLLFLATTTTFDTEPLLVLEFLHRIVDALEEFLGAPLLETKIENGYDIVAQLLAEMCDAGAVSTTEPNALRDLVEVPGWMGKLLGGVGLPGSSLATPSLSNPLTGQAASTTTLQPPAPQLLWRRANVRHTSNELYVDIIESLSIVIAPSGRILSAFAYGTIVFTSKISGVPDLLLTLTSSSGGKSNIDRVLELPVFHPCVRLSRWREKPGEVSFVPPDGRFILAGYEVDLLPPASSSSSSSGTQKLPLPVNVEVRTCLGANGNEFEVRLWLSNDFAGVTSSTFPNHGSSSSSSRALGIGVRGSSAGLGAGLGARLGGGGGIGGASSSPFLTSSAQQPSFENVLVSIPIPTANVRTITDLHATRGEVHYVPTEGVIEWRIPSRETASGMSAVLKGSVVGLASTDNDDDGDGDDDDGNEINEEKKGHEGRYDMTSNTYAYDDDDEGDRKAKKTQNNNDEDENMKKKKKKTMTTMKMTMPSSVQLSFSIKGWLSSGLKIDSLNIQHRSSRGVGDGIRPYKGVKYLTVSEKGVEVRC